MPAPQIYAKNKSDLSRLIGITRATLDAWIKEDGSPRPAANGRWKIAEWEEFKKGRKIEDHDTPASDTAELKRKKLQQEIELNDIKILRESGDLVPVDWAKQLVAHWSISTCHIIKDSGLAECDKVSIVEKIEAINFENFLSQLRTQVEADLAGEPEKGKAGTGESQAPGENQLSGLGET